MLDGLKYTDDMQNQERGIVLGDIKLSLSTKECAELFGISELLARKHIEICGNNVYNKIIETFKEDITPYNNKNVRTVNQTEGWATFYADATVGNIFITKDSSTLGYTHGHVGVIQSHTGSTKYISEATGPNSDDTEEVVCRSLNYWNTLSTLCAMYPDTPTVDDRVSAGNQTYYYTIADNYTYEVNNTKANVRNSSYTKLNCVGLAYRAYYFMAQFDIIPQVGVNAIMLPSQVYYSANMNFKVKDVGGYLMTSNFNDYDWGF